MKVVKTIQELKKIIRSAKARHKTIGFVPTMGALHEGHLSLVRRSRRDNDVTVMSIFVNPKQFGPKEDFGRYPREEKKDKLLAQRVKVDIIFYPSVEEVYPAGYLTYVEVEELTEELCGHFRPGHFKGVATIVTKFLNIVTPDVLYLGQKDIQQAIVLTKMVDDLNIPAKVQVCPTVREKDGLAMSSRNVSLTSEQRKEAPILFQSLKIAQKKISQGERDAGKIITLIKSMIQEKTSGAIDYVECANAQTLKSLKWVQGKVLLALAVKFGKTRLIDNLILSVK